jgi:hypothetical protein
MNEVWGGIVNRRQQLCGILIMPAHKFPSICNCTCLAGQLIFTVLRGRLHRLALLWKRKINQLT